MVETNQKHTLVNLSSHTAFRLSKRFMPYIFLSILSKQYSGLHSREGRGEMKNKYAERMYIRK